ncbi:MAG: hypothetical protein ORN98_10965, partial [Alphaproteobacteria bacterium]|nr:hypothetical protein [Alphaproteobacteria bacterium]
MIDRIVLIKTFLSILRGRFLYFFTPVFLHYRFIVYLYTACPKEFAFFDVILNVALLRLLLVKSLSKAS